MPLFTNNVHAIFDEDVELIADVQRASAASLTMLCWT
jgi:hypothetical protein